MPPCDKFVFSFGWPVIDPFPAEDVDLRWLWGPEGNTEGVGEGVSGIASVGCGNIQARNNGASKLSFEAHFKITSST